MKRTYQVVTKPSTLSSRELAEFLSKDGQLLLPLVELLERGEKAIDEVIDVMGRATVEAVLRMSAEQRAGPKRQGRRADDRALYWHGSQPGRVTLSERQLRVEKPRLRKKTARQGERGEVAIPAYDAMQRDRPGVRRRQRGTALSQPQAAECRRPPAERAARPGTGHPARRLEARG